MLRALTLFVAVILTVLTTSTSPASSASMENASAQEIVEGASYKLVRGIANTTTGIIELPKQIYQVSAKSGPLYGVTVGPLMGIGMFLARTGAGLFEVVTFIIPIPDSYDPIIEPEYSWQGWKE